MPHAWKPGAQTELLVKKLNALKDGDDHRDGGAAEPYRCPPGPYERVSMFAHVLKKKGHKKSKIIVLDPKATFSKQALFLEGWEKHYPGMVEWQDPKIHGGIKSVDPKTGIIKTDLAEYKADARQHHPGADGRQDRARREPRGRRPAGLPIDPENMKSKADSNIFVVGDACIPGDMPKSAFSANSQAKVAAMIIGAELAGARVPGALFQHLLEPDRDRRRREGRRRLRAGRGQAEGQFDVRQPEGRERRLAQAELQGVRRLVQQHRGGRVRLRAATLAMPAARDAPLRRALAGR